MTIRIINHADDTTQVIREENLEMVQFEDQRHIGNGMWLHCVKKNGKVVSISFDPKNDWFDIFEAK